MKPAVAVAVPVPQNINNIYAKMKSAVPQNIVDLYTDILAHRYEPNGSRVVCGTTTGKIVILERDEEKNEVIDWLNGRIPSGDAVLGLDWATCGIFVGVKKGIYFYKSNPSKRTLVDDPILLDCMFDVMDIRYLPNGRFAAACDDGKTRVFDIETQKLILTVADHSSAVEVLSSSDEHLATGGQDGNIFIYENQFRTPNSVWNINVGAKLAPGLALSKSSTWIAAGTQGAPSISNLRAKVALPPIQTDSSQSIYTITFGEDGALWWGGGGTKIYSSECMTSVTSEMKTAYGDDEIHHIFSIATGHRRQMSVAGSSNGLLFTDNGKYWDTYVRL